MIEKKGKEHPNSGIVILSNEEAVCYECYLEQFARCPLCGKLWEEHPPEDVDCRITI